MPKRLYKCEICGHRKSLEANGKRFELFTGLEIPSKKRFYLRDNNGYYYIPEVKDAISENKEGDDLKR